MCIVTFECLYACIYIYTYMHIYTYVSCEYMYAGYGVFVKDNAQVFVRDCEVSCMCKCVCILIYIFVCICTHMYMNV